MKVKSATGGVGEFAGRRTAEKLGSTPGFSFMANVER